MNDLTGKIAWVTGSTGNIGAHVAKDLKEMGARVITHGTQKLDFADHVCGDLTDLQIVKELVNNIGQIDILVCCAGGNRRLTGRGSPPNDDCLKIGLDEFLGVFDRNFMTAYHCCRMVVPGMIERQWGRVVTVGSCLVGFPRPNSKTASYALSKAALHEYTIHLASQVREANVTVNCVALSSTKLDKPEVGTLNRPASWQESAAMISFLCTAEAGYVSGEIIRVHGGNIRNQSLLNRETSVL